MIVAKNTWLLLCIVLLGCISCKEVNNKQVQALDALELQLDSVATMLEPVTTNFEKLDNYHNTAKASLKFIQKNYLDTMPLDLGVFLSDYRSDRKLLGWSVEHYTKCLNELNYSRLQVKQLRADVENNLVGDVEFQEYQATEATNIETLLDDTYELSLKWEKGIKRFEERNPKVQELVKELGG